MFFFVLFIVYSNFAIANKRKEIMEYAIIAAGEGSRLAHEGVGLPKPLVKVHGEALIDRLIRIFMDNGASAIHVICNDLTTQVSEHLSILKSEGLNGRELPLDFTIKTTPSSMHSFYELSKHLGNGPFILTTVDTIFREEEFSDYVRTFQRSTADGYDGLMGVTDYIDDEKPLYVGTDAAMNITRFYDEPQGDNQNDGAKYISGGIYGLTHQSISTLNHCMAKGMSRMRNFQRSLVADNLRLRAWPFSRSSTSTIRPTLPRLRLSSASDSHLIYCCDAEDNRNTTCRTFLTEFGRQRQGHSRGCSRAFGWKDYIGG